MATQTPRPLRGRLALIIAVATALLMAAVLTPTSSLQLAAGNDPLAAPPEPGNTQTTTTTTLPAPSNGELMPPLAAAGPLEPCQVPAPMRGEAVQSGFPLSALRLASTGVVRIAVVFVDYPNAVATESTQDTLDRNWPQAEEFLESVSNGELDMQLHVDHTWHRMSRNSPDYGFADGVTYQEHVDFIAEGVSLADPTFDFTGTEAIWVVGEHTAPGTNVSPALVQIATENGVSAEGGAVVFTNGLTRGNDWGGAATPGLDWGEMVIVHETLHNMGLPDLYEYGALYPNAHLAVGNFDPLGFLIGIDFSSTNQMFSTKRSNELFAWHSWQLGWVETSQMKCMAGSATVETLVPASSTGGMRAVVVPVNPTRVIVAEARMAARWDADTAQDGVLVYTVDSSIPSGAGPIVVQGAYPGDWPDSSVLLQPGDSMVVEGYRIQSLSQTGDEFEVQVSAMTCDGKSVTIDMNVSGVSGMGTAGDDVIVGTAGDDVINAGDGNDTVCAGDGDDVVVGGDGDDAVFGQDGRDVLRGGPDVDVIEGGAGNDRVLGGTGGDTLDGGEGDDYIGGFGGNDTIIGGPGNEIIYGGFGADTINAGAGDDEVHGLIGDDSIAGGPGNDEIDGDRGNDSIAGGDGNDIIRGGNASDTLFGDGGDDELSGGKADDMLSGGSGSDTCIGNRQTLADAADATCELRFGIP